MGCSSLNLIMIELVLKSQITPKCKAHGDSKAEYTLQYVSILNRYATQQLGVRWGFKTNSNSIFESLDLLLMSGIHAVSAARAAGLQNSGRCDDHLRCLPVFY